MKIGDLVKISPDVTGANDWQDAVVTDVEQNPFNGVVITAKTLIGGILYFNRQSYFKMA